MGFALANTAYRALGSTDFRSDATSTWSARYKTRSVFITLVHLYTSRTHFARNVTRPKQDVKCYVTNVNSECKKYPPVSLKIIYRFSSYNALCVNDGFDWLSHIRTSMVTPAFTSWPCRIFCAWPQNDYPWLLGLRRRLVVVNSQPALSGDWFSTVMIW